MYKNWPQIAADMTAITKSLRSGAPEVMKAFGAIAQAATEPKVLDTKTKELVALGIAVATRCDPCITFHTESARKHGATRDEIMETVGMAIYMGAGPSVMYAAQAVEAYDQWVAKAAVPAAEQI
jgi:AhpD family alkylhydroperoxidase